MNLLNVKNRAEGTLASGISDSDLSLTLTTGQGAKFPTSNFHITIEDEILLCSSRTGDVCTVERHKEGTSAAAHSVGKTVELRITAQIITDLNEIHQSMARAYRSDGYQVIPSGAYTKVAFNTENYDEQSEFDSSVKAGTADGTVANHLQDDTSSQFTAADVGKTVWNKTDETYTTITAYNDAGDVTLADDIFVNGETYDIYFSRFTAKKAGRYLITSTVQMRNGADGVFYLLLIYKNGTATSRTRMRAGASGDFSPCISDILELSLDDYVEIFIYQAQGTNLSLADGSNDSWLAIHRLS